MEQINILEVNITKSSRPEVLKKIDDFLNDDRNHQIVTPNPEIILAAREDKKLFDILNKADLALPDGVGLKIAAWSMGINLERITGADLLKDILAMAEAQSRRVAIFNWQGGLSSESDIRQALAVYCPKLQVMVVAVERGVALPEDTLALVNSFQPEIIFSTLGASHQEKFIFHNLSSVPTAKIGLGVGGSFDFLTGKLPRAPLWLRNMGLEWLWRLIKQPRRWKRIYNAVVVFPVKFIIWRSTLRK